MLVSVSIVLVIYNFARTVTCTILKTICTLILALGTSIPGTIHFMTMANYQYFDSENGNGRQRGTLTTIGMGYKPRENMRDKVTDNKYGGRSE